MISRIAAEKALGRLTPEERRWVEEFSEKLRADLGGRLKDLRIFGSKIRGESHDESDIDLLVLLDHGRSEDRTRIIDLAFSISSWLDVKVMDFDQYHSPASRATGFYEEMRSESVRL